METKNSVIGLPANSAANLVQLITTSYSMAVGNLGLLANDSFKRERNRLFWGSRVGSKVEGVRDERTVTVMLQRSIMSNGLMRPVYKDVDGNHVYCFKLNHNYRNRDGWAGRTTYARLSDICDVGEIDRINFGVDFDEKQAMPVIRIQGPRIRSIESNMITVILGPDNSTFVEWFCGEPTKYYTKDNIHELLGPKGELLWENVWVQVFVDYDQRGRDKRIRHNHKHGNDHDTKHDNKHETAPLNNLSVVLDQAFAPASTDPAPVPQVS